MQKYKKDYLRSRSLTQYDFIPCEICGAEHNDIHHITGSFRGVRIHDPEGTDLIALCRSCHDYVHKRNTPQMKISLLAIVQYTLITQD